MRQNIPSGRGCSDDETLNKTEGLFYGQSTPLIYRAWCFDHSLRPLHYHVFHYDNTE